MKKISRVLGSSLAGAVVLGFAVGAQAQGPTEFDHYLCYKGALMSAKTEGFVTPLPNKTLTDQFESRIYDAKNPIWHCNPVTKTYKGNTSGIHFSDIHLQGYPIALTKIPPQSADEKPSITTVDQFGLLRLKVLKPESLRVRTSTDIIATGSPVAPKYTACGPTKPCGTGVCFPGPSGFCVSAAGFPPDPPNDGRVDNFKCYSVALNGQKFTKIVNQVNLQDEFWSPLNTFDIKKPTRVCTPVDKNNENPDAPTHEGHLVCYQILGKKVKATDPPPPQDKYLGNKVADSNGNFTPNHFDVRTVNELCLPATKAECGDGTVDAPYEECDSPKICSGGSHPGDPCAKSPDCDGGGTCIPNKTQCPGGVACSANCTCPLPPAAVAVNNPCPVYHEPGSFFDVCQSLLGAPCGAPRPVPAFPTDPGGATFNLCTSAADALGMRALTVDPTTWFADAVHLDPPAAPLEITMRLCATTPMTGVLFTKANAATFAAKFCVAGDPAKLRTSCVNSSDCDGPPATTGNGVCAKRDVDYTSVTSNAGTTFTFGDGIADPAGSALFAQDLDVGVWLAQDASCTGTGSDPSCVGCDDVTPAPAGRIGTLAAAGPPEFTLPFITRFTTGSAENIVNEAGNALNGREVIGSGTPGLTASLVMVGGNAKLETDTSPAPFGFWELQFFEKQVFAPLVP